MKFKGDIDHEALRQELVVVLGPQGNPERWYPTGSEGVFEFVKVDPTLDDSGVVAIVEAHIAVAASRKKQLAVNQVKQIRRNALDRYVPSSGISDVYNENLTAAKAHLGGTGATTTMRDGTTATAHCTAKGGKMGYTANQFAGYIVSENQRVALLASQVEEEYLRVAYAWLPAQTDPAVITAAVTDYQTYCDARKP